MIYWTMLAKTIKFKFEGGFLSLSSRQIKDVTEHFNTEFELEQMLAFEKEKDLGSAKRAFQQQIEKCRANIKWMARNAETTMKWFEDQIH